MPNRASRQISHVDSVDMCNWTIHIILQYSDILINKTCDGTICVTNKGNGHIRPKVLVRPTKNKSTDYLHFRTWFMPKIIIVKSLLQSIIKKITHTDNFCTNFKDTEHFITMSIVLQSRTISKTILLWSEYLLGMKSHWRARLESFGSFKATRWMTLVPPRECFSLSNCTSAKRTAQVWKGAHATGTAGT
jgi:hypothetical protein